MLSAGALLVLNGAMKLKGGVPFSCQPAASDDRQRNSGGRLATEWHAPFQFHGAVQHEQSPADGTFQVNALVPEPSSFVLSALGAVGMLSYGWCRRVRETAVRS